MKSGVAKAQENMCLAERKLQVQISGTPGRNAKKKDNLWRSRFSCSILPLANSTNVCHLFFWVNAKTGISLDNQEWVGRNCERNLVTSLVDNHGYHNMILTKLFAA